MKPKRAKEIAAKYNTKMQFDSEAELWVLSCGSIIGGYFTDEEVTLMKEKDWEEEVDFFSSEEL